MVDLFGEDTFVADFAVSEEGGALTISFIRPGETPTNLGDLVIDQSRFRALVEALSHIAKEQTPDGVDRDKAKTTYNINQNQATIEFR